MLIAKENLVLKLIKNLKIISKLKHQSKNFKSPQTTPHLYHKLPLILQFEKNQLCQKLSGRNFLSWNDPSPFLSTILIFPFLATFLLSNRACKLLHFSNFYFYNLLFPTQQTSLARFVKLKKTFSNKLLIMKSTHEVCIP